MQMILSKKDVFGYDVFHDDIVAFNPPYVKGLIKGKVHKLTPKGFTVKYNGHFGIMKTNVPHVVKHQGTEKQRW